MKLKSKQLFPHPVLCTYLHIYNSSFFGVFRAEIDASNYKINFHLRSPGLEKLLKQDKAYFAMRIQNTRMFLDKIFIANSNAEIILPKNYLDSDCKNDAVLLLNQEMQFSELLSIIEDDLTDDYRSLYNISLQAGDSVLKPSTILAKDRVASLREKIEGKNSSNLFKFIESKEVKANLWKLYLEHDSIIYIHLNSENYKTLERLSKKIETAEILYAIIMVPLLIEILYEMRYEKDLGKPHDSDYSSKTWYKDIDKLIHEALNSQAKATAKVNTIFELVHKLLDYPLKPAGDNLHNLIFPINS